MTNPIKLTTTFPHFPTRAVRLLALQTDHDTSGESTGKTNWKISTLDDLRRACLRKISVFFELDRNPNVSIKPESFELALANEHEITRDR